MKCGLKKNNVVTDGKETRAVRRERKVKGKDLNKKSVGHLLSVLAGWHQEIKQIKTDKN